MRSNNTYLNPYLAFEGNCEEAMSFYHQSLGGELDIKTFEESPSLVAEGYEKKVMHALLTFGDAVLMASDVMPNQDAKPGTAISLSIAAKTIEEGQQMFDALAKGGQIIMPFEKAFWHSIFGMLTDKFGIRWMVNVNVEK